MSWKWKIGILYGGFVVLILTMVVLCYGQKVDLERPDYYAQELKYQDRINAIQNALEPGKNIEHEVSGNFLELRINPEFLADVKGEAYFFRPSDASKDKRFPLVFSADGRQQIDLMPLEKGVYKMQLSWTENDKDFYKEAVIYIQP